MKGSYLTYLRSLAIVHAVLERAISKSEHGVLRAIWRENMRKLPLLEADIQVLCDGKLKDQTQPISISLKIVEVIRSLALQNSARLAGYLYVLEGSTNGGTHTHPRVTQAFGLVGDTGVRYLKNYEEAQPEHWQAFKERLNTAVKTEAEISEALQGAKDLYGGLIAVLEALGATTGSEWVERVHVTAINPEAGNHKAPQDELEIMAAKVAADVCLVGLPYVSARYGERGIRYTRSDGAWLATLPDLPAEVVMKQVNWLGKLLSALGMPRFALEMHLRETQKALTSFLPHNGCKYDVLSAAADHLESLRNSVIPLALQNELNQKFLHGLNEDWTGSFRNLSQILISAVADEEIDHLGALKKTIQWITSRSNWPDPVIVQCQSLVTELGISTDESEP